jgi:hypothetical protein
MNDVHIVLGSIAIALNGGAGLWGGWRYWRAEPSILFWRLLRAGQASIVVTVALGGVLLLLKHKAPSLHYIYGLLPLLVSFIAEQLRISSAQMVLDARGLENAAAVGELGEDEQRGVVRSILLREMGVMTLAAIVCLVLLIRAAGTAG